MVYLAVSMVNECKYCLSHREVTVRQAAITDREVSLANFTNRLSNGLGIPVEGREVNVTAP
jgi:AhpD family alkylhydroperoxidase